MLGGAWATIGKRTALAVVLLVTALVLARPAAAQLTFGSPSDPARLSLGIGAFDITPSPSHADAKTAGEFRGEYHFGDVLWIIAPFFGGSVTSDGAFYGYGGFGFDINFTPNIVLRRMPRPGFSSAAPAPTSDRGSSFAPAPNWPTASTTCHGSACRSPTPRMPGSPSAIRVSSRCW